MNEENNLRVTIDTNLLISAIITKRNTTPNTLLNLWRLHGYQLILSADIFLEVENVLKREKIYKKYHISPEEIVEFLNELQNSVDFFTPLQDDFLAIRSRDPKDDKFLACALAGNCDYLITDDEDLLILDGDKALGNLRIVKAADFLHREGKNKQ